MYGERMERWSYFELKQYVYKDFEEFTLKDGLQPRQAISRIQVEYERVMDESYLESVIIYSQLASIALEKNFISQREDIRLNVSKMLKEIKYSDFQSELTIEELAAFKRDLDEVTNKLNDDSLRKT
ncbi:hypothetical protein GC096_32810 [Paenibacillus sp. LMG 31461]|uniref:Uncharacterized protein n=1 Tax=Paenibacillus plantarum TaxID=2654975 RepID=A0ABX1XLI0_9BACL|nr:Imm3 family immunity protein [Paenibacillus plantarum]NOU68806.1 hypothetical protein [Paenibacillus plantarum]